jgi:hypothetical protein
MLGWVSAMLGWLGPRSSKRDSEEFSRREAELRERLERLTREVEVIQRDGTNDEPRQ